MEQKATPEGSIVLAVSVERATGRIEIVHNSKGLADLQTIYNALATLQTQLVNEMLAQAQAKP